jgi:hypothetical protein
MKLAFVLGLALLFLAAAILITGSVLPATRDGTATRILNAPPDLVRRTILDTDAQPAWRTGIVAVERGAETTWTEVKADGERIAFRLAEDEGARIVLTFDSTRGYTGRWEGRLDDIPEGTRLTVTEQATIRSPLGRILARMFFDPEAFAAKYLEDLDAEVARRRTEGG